LTLLGMGLQQPILKTKQNGCNTSRSHPTSYTTAWKVLRNDLRDLRAGRTCTQPLQHTKYR
jgi:hypothetical protein